ncbi:peptidoglycan-binding domain-containing protein [Carboxydothermus hydrogenoformans]|uniref:Putative peptidoglycan binding protein n=1 Tax=Carboxydothermus hydrogenoformans (strain ATCC BAA-161 / DSM 6008 / Z-2901) TaxID=246194 RepID=Q3AAW4_CARHZ|nr:peptidoglycan-binding domain-containing protein [Carboxydothermus hydrogenoformans]ABB15036.1 putative peptidoglycan binding protein [Carboxydothermus hydrogenoformans Z-2901]
MKIGKKIMTAIIMTIFVISLPEIVLAHPMQDNWYNNDYVGYGYVTSGGYVLAIQRMLKDTPYGYSSVDGYYGSLTQKGIEDFQRSEKIQVDGIVGKVTWGEFQDYRFYLGTNGGSGQFYAFIYSFSDQYPAKYFRDACSGWYIDCSLTNQNDYWHVDHDFEKLTVICL